MENWLERLRQAKQTSEQKSKEDNERENVLYQRLFSYLDKFKVRKLLEDVKNEVWEAGNIREVHGNNGSGGICAALQLYYTYEAAREIYQRDRYTGAFGQDLSHFWGTGFYETVYENVFLAVGAVSIPRDFNPEPTRYRDSLIKAGDYMYLVSLLPDRELRGWGFDGSRGGTSFINLSSQDQKISEFVEKGLLSRISSGYRSWLPLNLKDKGKKDIERYRSQGLLRKG